MPESLMFSHVTILFLVSLLFGALRSIPTHYLNLNFLLVCLLFIAYLHKLRKFLLDP